MEANPLVSSLTQEQLTIVREIENYGASYDPGSGLTLEDQLLACEAVAESTPIIERNETKNNQLTDKLVFNGNGVGNGACYSGVNLELIENCRQAIEQLKNYSSLSAPVEIAATLERQLGKSNNAYYWLNIAQRFNPRQIRWMLKDVIRQYVRGEITIKNFYGYFYSLQTNRKPKVSVRKREREKKT